MYKIQTLNNIASSGLAEFPSSHYHISTDEKNADAIIVRSADMQAMVLPSSTVVVGRAGAGVNNIPVSQLTALGIPVMNTPGANANAVKELVLAGMFLASRHICQAWQYVQQLSMDDNSLSQHIEKNKKQFAGFELQGKTLGVIGFGNIGVKVANAALALNMRVIGYDPTITVKNALALSSLVQQADSLETLFKQADFISIHVPLTAETTHFINTARLSLLKPSAVLLNFSREEIVDSEALFLALQQNHLQSYVTDFPSAQIKDHPRVICLPHLGASTQEAEENCAIMIAQQVRDYLENGNIKNAVNFPEVYLLRNQHYRLTIVNANIPSMVAQISQQLAAAGLNIVDLINKSKDDIAYTMLDVDKPVDHEVVENISKINGVIRVRFLGNDKK